MWVRTTSENYKWLHKLWLFLSHEYTYRYNKIHASYALLETYLNLLPAQIPIGNRTPVPQAMPVDSKRTNAVNAYRNYYINYKRDFAKWTRRATPNFMNGK